jgi:hypothetical protein
MTTAHKIQIAIFGLTYVWLSWIIYQEARTALKDMRRKREG